MANVGFNNNLSSRKTILSVLVWLSGIYLTASLSITLANGSKIKAIEILNIVWKTAIPNGLILVLKNFRLKKVPRIYADCYEYEIEPTKQSIKILKRE